MKGKRILAIGIIVVIGLIVVMVFGCKRTPMFISTVSTSVSTEEEGMPTYDLNSSLVSGIIQGNAPIRGIVKEISGRDLIIRVFDIGRGKEEAFYLSVPVTQEATIIFRYIAPEGTPEEEITGSIAITGRGEEEEFKTAQKEIRFDEIKVGDYIRIFFYLNSDNTIKEMFIEVLAKDLSDELYGL